MELKVVMFPADHGVMQAYASSLREHGTDVALIPSFHQSPVKWMRDLRALRTQGYNVLHVHWLFFFVPPLLDAFRIASRRLGYRTVWEVHNVEPHGRSIEVAGPARRRFYQQADAVIHHTLDARMEAESRLGPARRSFLIPLPLLGRIGSRMPKEEARARLGEPQDAVTFLAFGNIRAYKGYDVLLDATTMITSPQARFIIAGKPEDAELVRKIRVAAKRDPRIRLEARFIPEDEIDALFAACDVVVQPHHAITTSGAVMMGLTHSRPVIASAIGNSVDVIRPGRTGLLVPPGNVAALADALRQTVENRGLPFEGAEVLAPYSLSAVTNAFRAVYAATLE